MRNGIITSWDEVPIVMDLTYACRILGKSYEHLKYRCRNNQFPGFKDGKVTKDDLLRYIEENKNTAK